MQTDELIDRLVLDAAPVRRSGVARRLAVAGGFGALGAFLLMVRWLHMRPDLMQAMGTSHWWLKMTYGLVLGLAGFVALERLSRPAGSGRRGLTLALAALGLLVILGCWQLVTTAPADRMAVWLGQSWKHCPYNILALSGPMLLMTMFVARGLAPTRLTAAGAACGLFAGGVAMSVYCLHCPETEPAFIATWYSAGAILTTAVGALLGPMALRWR